MGRDVAEVFIEAEKGTWENSDTNTKIKNKKFKKICILPCIVFTIHYILKLKKMMFAVVVLGDIIIHNVSFFFLKKK